jgi:hypothetical protein
MSDPFEDWFDSVIDNGLPTVRDAFTAGQKQSQDRIKELEAQVEFAIKEMKSGCYCTTENQHYDSKCDWCEARTALERLKP